MKIQAARITVHVFLVHPFFRWDGIVKPLRLFFGDGRRFRFRAGLELRDVLIDFIGGTLAGVTVLFLQNASQHIEFAIGPFQVIIGEFAPPGFGFALDLFPLAFEYVIIHI
jgi:hypothetical protein